MVTILPTVPTKIFIYQLNTQIFEIDGLQDQNGNYLNSATVTMSLVDQNGAPVPNCSNITMNYLAASQGIYQGLIPATFDPTQTGTGYYLHVDATSGQSVGHWEFPVEVTIRRQ